MAAKRYDAGTRLDANGRVIGHYCAGERPCLHCEAYPFAYPQNWALVSDRTLDVLAERALAQVDEALAAFRAIKAERVARGAA